MNEKEALINKVKEMFGTIETCNLPSYILPDGSVLNIIKYSSPNFEYHPHTPAAQQILETKDQNATSIFIEKTGAIRFFPLSHLLNIEININNPISKKQYERLEDCACFGIKEKHIVYDFVKNDKIIKSSGTYDLPNDSLCIERIKKVKEAFNKERNKIND